MTEPTVPFDCTALTDAELAERLAFLEEEISLWEIETFAPKRGELMLSLLTASVALNELRGKLHALEIRAFRALSAGDDEAWGRLEDARVLAQAPVREAEVEVLRVSTAAKAELIMLQGDIKPLMDEQLELEAEKAHRRLIAGGYAEEDVLVWRTSKGIVVLVEDMIPDAEASDLMMKRGSRLPGGITELYGDLFANRDPFGDAGAPERVVSSADLFDLVMNGPGGSSATSIADLVGGLRSRRPHRGDWTPGQDFTRPPRFRAPGDATI